jgi:hypothetical protein
MSDLAPRRIVVVLQFWDGDREAAFRNARRIADNEPHYRKDVEIMLCARFDAKHDDEIRNYLARKFRVSQYTGYRRSVGWPDGCNELVMDLFQESIRRVRSGDWWDVKALYLMEADCVPVHREWLTRLHAEWDATEQEGKWLCGWWGDSCSPVGHMNGNLLVHPLIAQFLPDLIGGKAGVAWDAYFAPRFHPHWRKAGFMENLYKQTNISSEWLRAVTTSTPPLVLIHGVKDLSVEAFADAVLRK